MLGSSILFIYDIWKKVFEVFSSTRKYIECIGVPVRISHLWKQSMNMWLLLDWKEFLEQIWLPDPSFLVEILKS